MAVGSVCGPRGKLDASRPLGHRRKKRENSPVYLIREVRKLAQTDLFTSFERKLTQIRRRQTTFSCV